MKIAIWNTEKPKLIHTRTDFRDMSHGLIGQTIAELEVIKSQLVRLYEERNEAES